jgi:hypothetical protein
LLRRTIRPTPISDANATAAAIIVRIRKRNRGINIAEATASRWETGAQIQQRALDAFLRVFFESAEARRILRAGEKPDKSAQTHRRAVSSTQ